MDSICGVAFDWQTRIDDYDPASRPTRIAG
jgi:hypothetical protein